LGLTRGRGAAPVCFEDDRYIWFNRISSLPSPLEVKNP
jgi:hypothetical protein